MNEDKNKDLSLDLEEEDKKVIENDSNTDEVLCVRCGKVLPEGSKYCVFCGCNNDLVKEVNASHNSSIKTNTPIKVMFEEEKTNQSSMLKKIICYLIFTLVIIFSILYIKNFDKIGSNIFKYNFNYNSKDIIFLDEDEYFINDNGSIKYYGSKYSNIYNSIKDLEIKDIKTFYNFNDYLIIYTKDNNIYNVSLSTKKLKKLNKIKLNSNNIYEAYNTTKNYTCNNNDYFISDVGNYYYYNKSIYKYIKLESKNTYNSELIIDNNTLNLNNPTLLYQYNNIIILKDDNKIIYINSDKVENSSELKIDKDIVKLDEMKYVFANDELIYLIDNNNKTYTFNIDSNYLTNKVTYKYKDNAEDSSIIKDYIIGELKLNFQNSPFKLITLILFILFDLFFIYSIRNSKFVNKLLSFAGLLTIEIVVAYVMINSGISLNNLPKIKIFAALIFTILVYSLYISVLFMQLQEIVLKIEEVINIENIISFYLLLIANITLFFAITMSISIDLPFIFIYSYIIGLVWFLYVNDSNKNFNNNIVMKNTYIIIGLSILLIIFNDLILINLFHIQNHFLLILFLSIILGGYFGLKDNAKLTHIIKNIFCPIISTIVLIISIFLITLIEIVGTEIDITSLLIEYGKIIIILLIFVSIVSLVCYIIKIIISKIINIFKIENSYFKILIYILVILPFVVLLLLNYNELLNFIINFIYTDDVENITTNISNSIINLK